jgi:glyoxylase-like metal-dependent hydrolase (beta-lactamase superfamily II)
LIVKLREILKQRKGELAGLALTHGHGGHSGNVDALRREFSGLAVYRGSPVTKSDTIVKNNELLTVPGLKIRALATPGHTSDSFSFALEEEGAVFTGDSVFSVPVPSRLDDIEPLELSSYIKLSSPGYLNSMSALLARFPYFLLPGHGDPVLPNESPATFLERAMEAQEMLGRTVVQAIKGQGPGKLVPTKTVVAGVLKRFQRDVLRDLRRLKVIEGNIRIHLLELADRGAVVRHPPVKEDPSKVFGPGGLNMVQVMVLIKDREAKDRQHGIKKPDVGKTTMPEAGSEKRTTLKPDEIEGSLWEVIS